MAGKDLKSCLNKSKSNAKKSMQQRMKPGDSFGKGGKSNSGSKPMGGKAGY